MSPQLPNTVDHSCLTFILIVVHMYPGTGISMRIGLSNCSPTFWIPNSRAPLDTSPVKSPPVTMIGRRLIVVASKLVPELLVIRVPLGIVAVAVPELNIIGTWRTIPVVLVIPLPLMSVIPESIHPVALIGDLKSSMVEFSVIVIRLVQVFPEASFADTVIELTVF